MERIAQGDKGAWQELIDRYDGRLLADHQISRTRFRNIMDKSGT